MFKEFVEERYDNLKNYNCAEKVLVCANEYYKLGLDKEALKLAGGFGSGMAIEDVCGCLISSVMVMGKLFIENYSHESMRIKILTREFLELYKKDMGYLQCGELKGTFKEKGIKCKDVVLKAAEILDMIVKRELNEA